MKKNQVYSLLDTTLHDKQIKTCLNYFIVLAQTNFFSEIVLVKQTNILLLLEYQSFCSWQNIKFLILSFINYKVLTVIHQQCCKLGYTQNILYLYKLLAALPLALRGFLTCLCFFFYKDNPTPLDNQGICINFP